MRRPELPQGNFLHNTLVFGRVLLELGLPVDPAGMQAAVSALDHIEVANKSDVYYTLRAVLLNDHRDYPLFDRAFNAFWKKHNKKWLALTLPPRPSGSPASNGRGSEDGEALLMNVSYSPDRALRHKDFAQLTTDEVKLIQQYIHNLSWSPPHKHTRRWQPRGTDRIDFRRTFRYNLRSGGELVAWRHKRPKAKPRPVVVLVDVSGSMEPYTRILLHFIYAVTAGLPAPVESFLFSTALTRVTRHLQTRQVAQAMQAVNQSVANWSGGTRIGEALRAFNQTWGRRVSSRNAVVLLVSDGWDRGDPEIVQREIARLRRGSHRLIWLNPLLGSPDYQPLTRGMQAALPHIDEFLPMHNLASLQALIQSLSLSSAQATPHPQRRPAPARLSHT